MRALGSLALVGLLVACDRGSSRPVAINTVPAGWVAISPPATQSEGAMCANGASDEWVPVLDAAGRLVAIRRAEGDGNTDTALVRGGRLIAVDRGEFGGEVRWEPAAGRPRKIAELNLRRFAATRGALLGVGGLAHMGSDKGQVVRFETSPDGKWTVRGLFDLGSAPLALVVLRGDTLLIVTAKGLMAATELGGPRMLYRASQWGLTYPNSIVRDAGGVVYVGMRSGVSRLTPNGAEYVEDWLVPTRCPLRRLANRDDTDCVCLPPGR